MNKITSISLVLSIFAFSANTLAASETCKQIEVQCENAAKLADALSPYALLCKNMALGSYNTASNLIASRIPEFVFTKTQPFAAREHVNFALTHVVLALGAATTLKVLQAVTAIPLSLMKLPFRNRVTMFCTGIVAKTIYDSYNAPN